MSELLGRKADHLDLAARGDVSFRRTTLLECVELLHDALPELDFDDIDLGCDLLGKRLRAPILIAAMTGGTERARAINMALAEVAEDLGLGIGLGSQRAMVEDAEVKATFQIRDAAPTALILGNIGGVQAMKMTLGEVEALAQAVDADALCVHLNPAMELIQAEGDRKFSGVLASIQRLVQGLSRPVVVKETGCGISPRVVERLRLCGARHVDVSGAGGTSWVAVETERATERRRGIGETFREWGVPTAPSVAFCAASGGFESIIATGGVANGLDIARAIALGANAAGIARPVLVALESGGPRAVRDLLLQVQTELRIAMLLCGASNLAALRQAPRLLRAPLTEWLGVNAPEKRD
ncbi:MAG TPA: type 2 isopentenyl-diphosphate Delta-isomerase [Polyangiaceae bacterium]|nr:type 2 isopentenyl-diphosphate Delta-isomerase [Polyangiaceae bacterium]